MSRWLWIGAVWILAAPAFAAGDAHEAAQRLIANGVRPTPDILADFLTHGFPETVRYDTISEEPAEKCQLLIDAMRLIGEARRDEALEPLAALARKDWSPGIASMIQRDLLLAAPGERAKSRERIVNFLQYNAAMALSLLGNPRSQPILLHLFETESAPSTKTQYALALASIGDRSGLDYLFEEIGKANQTSSLAAARAAYYIFGIDFGYRSVTPIARRPRLAGEYEDWWAANRDTAPLKPDVIIRRRLEPFPEPRLPMNSVRNLLKLSADFSDLADRRGSRTAQYQLEKMGESIDDELKNLMRDPMEDIDVRAQAMRYFAMHRGDEARSELRRLTDDENPEIAEFAKELMDSIKSGAFDPENEGVNG